MCQSVRKTSIVSVGRQVGKKEVIVGSAMEGRGTEIRGRKRLLPV